MKQKPILILLSLFFLVSCQPSLQSIETAIAETQAANPTETFTLLPPSNTPTTTETSTPTQTLTPSRTPTNTPTRTPEPLTATAFYQQQLATSKAFHTTATAKAKSVNSTFTASAKNSLATKNAKNITATAKAKLISSQSTSVARSAQATKIAQYVKINANELITYSENHKGEKVVIRGRVFNVNNNQEFQIWLDGISYEAVYIYMEEPYDDIFEDDYVTIYGVVIEKYCGTNSFGAETCMPLIGGVFYEKK